MCVIWRGKGGWGGEMGLWRWKGGSGVGGVCEGGLEDRVGVGESTGC